MSPLRKVALAILTLTLGLVAVVLIGTHVQRRRLADELVRDAEVLLSRRIDLPSKAEPRHENGYACLAGLFAAGTRFGSFSDLASYDKLKNEPVVPDAVKAELEALEPALASVRDCADARFLAPVPRARPLELENSHAQLMLRFSRASQLQLRVLAEEQRWGEAAERCASVLEVAVDQSHLDLIAAISAEFALRHLLPGCVNALGHLSDDARGLVAARFEALPARIASRREIMESERLEATFFGLTGLLDADHLSRLPPISGDFMKISSEPLHRFLLTRHWRLRDPVMRRLVQEANTPSPAREAALQQLEEIDAAWWLPAPFSFGPGYRGFLRRLEDADAMLQVLSVAAAGGVDYPPQISHVPTGLVFTSWDGKRLDIPLSQLPPCEGPLCGAAGGP